MTVVTEDWNSTTTLTVREIGMVFTIMTVATEGWNSTSTLTVRETEMTVVTGGCE